MLGVQVAVAKRLDVQVAGEPLVEHQEAGVGVGGRLVTRLAGAGLDVAGLAPLRERDLDQVEVARRDRAREGRPALVEHGAHVVARGDVDEGEQADVGVGGELGRLPGGRVPGLGRALDLLLGKARVVDEQLRPVGGDPGHLAGRGVAADDELAPGARLAHHLARVDRAGAALDALAAPGGA